MSLLRGFGLVLLAVGSLHVLWADAEAALVVYYDFEGDAQNVANPGTYDGSAFGDASFTGTGPTGLGSAAEFDGTNDGVRIGDLNELDGAERFTLTAWYRRDTNVTSNNDGPATNHDVNNVLFANSANNGNDNLEVGTANNNVELYIDSGSGSGNDTTRTFNAGTINNGTWYHLAVKFDVDDDPNEASVYVDGTLIGSKSWNGADLDGATDQPATLGIARFDRGDPWGDLDGGVDEFALWTGETLFDWQIEGLANKHFSPLQATVPEPATLLVWLLLTGLGVALGWRRRNK